LVFDHGRIVETGSFDELIQRGGAFAALAKAQFLVAGQAQSAPAPATEPERAVAAPPAEITEVAAEQPAT